MSPANIEREVRVVLLDNDGILVDTEHLYFQATREVLQEAGVTLSDEQYAQYLLVESRGAWHLAKERGATDSEISDMRARRNALYDALLSTEPIEIPGALDAVARLAKRFTLGIVTASEQGHFNTIHARTNFLEHVAFCVTENDYSNSKPDPEPYRLAVERAGHPVTQCIAIEDSERGLRSALGAGLRCYAVPRGMSRRTNFDGAEAVAESLMDVCERLGA